MKIAVTGGSGFIGAHVVDRLVAAGHDAVVVDRQDPGRGDVEFRQADILDLEAMVAATRGCGALFHLAGVADVNQASAEPVLTTRVNVAGTATVWEAARHNGIGRAVLASTVWVYAASPPAEAPQTEDSPLDPSRAGHIYTASKIAAEAVVHSYHHLYGQAFTILRYGIPFGPGMRDGLVISRFVRAALEGEPLIIDGDGTQYRNYVYVEDLADAHVLALAPAAANQVFNLEGPERISIQQLVTSLASVLDRDLDVRYRASRAGDFSGRPVSADKARQLLGWKPAISFHDGLRMYVDWCRTERASHDRR